MAPSFRDGIYALQPNGTRANAKAELVVPCVPLQYMLDRFGVHDIDFFSLDVEGAELEVLKTIDFGRTRISVILVEMDGRHQAKDDQVTQLLHHQGFTEVKRLELTVIFQHRSFRPEGKKV